MAASGTVHHMEGLVLPRSWPITLCVLLPEALSYPGVIFLMHSWILYSDLCDELGVGFWICFPPLSLVLDEGYQCTVSLVQRQTLQEACLGFLVVNPGSAQVGLSILRVLSTSSWCFDPVVLPALPF